MTEFLYWACVPAAGVGVRFGADRPKQYLKIGDRTILDHTLDVLVRHDKIAGIAVAISATDNWWKECEVISNAKVIRTAGGKQRCQSVLNGLQALLRCGANKSDRVLVHDAVRPCLSPSDLNILVETVGQDINGGLLALPVTDTVKCADRQSRVGKTLMRELVWRAQTPQLFPLGKLQDALTRLIAKQQSVTDESQALEELGLRPKLVAGSPHNIKITRPIDLAMAEFFLRDQGRL